MRSGTSTISPATSARPRLTVNPATCARLPSGPPPSVRAVTVASDGARLTMVGSLSLIRKLNSAWAFAT